LISFRFPRTTLPLVIVAALLTGSCGVGVDEDIDQLEELEFLPDDEGFSEVAITAAYHEGKVVQALRYLRLRAGPARRYDTITVIPKWARARIVRSGPPTSGYYKVTYGKRTGWAYGSYLQSESTNLVEYGMYPDASDALRDLNIGSSRVMQTIGFAEASGGTHKIDGYANDKPYTAAVDIWVGGYSHTQIRNLLERLARKGFAAWFRRPGYDGWPSSEVAHVHAVYVGTPAMKSSLKSQVRSWLAGRNGLASNNDYRYYNWSDRGKHVVRRIFNDWH
jgi:hypothetical protein